jgi:hypothetical protein
MIFSLIVKFILHLEKYMLKFKKKKMRRNYLSRQQKEILLKVFALLGILTALTILYATGIAFNLGFYTKTNVTLHYFAAGIIVFLFILHTWLRRCSARRLIQEFKDIIRHRQIDNEENKSFIIQNIKNQTLRELASFFHWNLEQVKQELPLNHVEVENVDDTLKEIAKQNDKDLYDIYVLITKIHIEKNSSAPVANNFC